MRPAAAIPTTDSADAVKEIERAVRLGLTALILPEIPQPCPYWAPEYEPIWAAAEANGLPIFFHVASGGVELQGRHLGHRQPGQGHPDRDVDGQAGTHRRPAGRAHHGRRQHRRRQPDADHRRPGQRRRLRAAPEPAVQRDRVQRGLARELHGLDGQGAGAPAPGRTRTGGSASGTTGKPCTSRSSWAGCSRSTSAGRMPLKPSEYVKRNIRVQFADDRMAVQSRHITGVDTIYWGNDYPHAEGTFLGSQAVIEEQIPTFPTRTAPRSSAATWPRSSASTPRRSSPPSRRPAKCSRSERRKQTSRTQP